eukprot:395088-Rhodomonas_salina.1
MGNSALGTWNAGSTMRSQNRASHIKNEADTAALHLLQTPRSRSPLARVPSQCVGLHSLSLLIPLLSQSQHPPLDSSHLPPSQAGPAVFEQPPTPAPMCCSPLLLLSVSPLDHAAVLPTAVSRRLRAVLRPRRPPALTAPSVLSFLQSPDKSAPLWFPASLVATLIV